MDLKELRLKIKHNFLKQIIFRLDFTGLLDVDIERTVTELRDYIYKRGYINYEERHDKEVGFQFQPNLFESNSFSVNDINKFKVYKFSSSNNEIIELSNKFLTITINTSPEYSSFDPYIEVIERIVFTLKKASLYFKSNRIGLRKLNLCFIRELSRLNDYLDNAAINIGQILNQFDKYNYKASNFTNLLEKDIYKVNYMRNIQEGVMEGKVVYQLVLDTDVYIDNVLHLGVFMKDEETIHNLLVGANTCVVDMYINSLNKDFLNKLTQENFLMIL